MLAYKEFAEFTNSVIYVINLLIGIDSDDREMKIDFSSYNHVSYAFDSLLAIFQQDMAKVSSDKFTAIKASCEARASEPLRDLIKCASDIDHLLKTI